MFQIKTFAFNPFQVNTYVLYNDDQKECIIVDPACYTEEEYNILFNFLKETNLEPKFILNTHCHIDHVLGIDRLKETFNIPFYANSKDQYLLDAAIEHGQSFGINLDKIPVIDKSVDENDAIYLGEFQIRIFNVPGHSNGSLAFYIKEIDSVLTGDVLFDGSIGRTDLPGGNFEVLEASIKTKLYTLPDETIVYCGHGGTTAIGVEKSSNPFVLG